MEIPEVVRGVLEDEQPQTEEQQIDAIIAAVHQGTITLREHTPIRQVFSAGMEYERQRKKQAKT